jgi:hypothetical protein
MFTRKVKMRLKPNSAVEFSRVFKNDIIPELKKQHGFRDEVTFVSPERAEAIAISFWDGKDNADAFGRNAYAGLVSKLAHLVEGEPLVETHAVSNSTMHGVAAQD